MSLPRPYYGHDDVDHEFGFHSATPVTGAVHEAVRQVARTAAHRFVELLPEGPLKTLAIRSLQTAMMQANAAVATQTNPIWQEEMTKLRGDQEFYPRLVLEHPDGEEEADLLEEARRLLDSTGGAAVGLLWRGRYSAYLDRRKRASAESTASLPVPKDQRPYTTKDAEQLARALHEASRELSGGFGYEIIGDHDVNWSALPEQGRAVMVAMCCRVLGVPYPKWVAEVRNNPSAWEAAPDVHAEAVLRLAEALDVDPDLLLRGRAVPIEEPDTHFTAEAIEGAVKLAGERAAELIFQALGAASVCWIRREPEGVADVYGPLAMGDLEFDSTCAAEVGRALMLALGYEVPETEKKTEPVEGE